MPYFFLFFLPGGCISLNHSFIIYWNTFYVKCKIHNSKQDTTVTCLTCNPGLISADVRLILWKLHEYFFQTHTVEENPSGCHSTSGLLGLNHWPRLQYGPSLGWWKRYQESLAWNFWEQRDAQCAVCEGGKQVGIFWLWYLLISDWTPLPSTA